MAEIQHVLCLSEERGTVRVRVEVTGDGGLGEPWGRLRPARSSRSSLGAAKSQHCRADGLGVRRWLPSQLRPEPAVGFSKLGNLSESWPSQPALANPASSLGVRAAPVIISVCLVPSEEQALDMLSAKQVNGKGSL